VEQRRLGRVAELSRNEKKHGDEKDYALENENTRFCGGTMV